MVVMPASHMLQKAWMNLISRKQCLKQIPQLEENVLCAELTKGERGTCQVNRLSNSHTVYSDTLALEEKHLRFRNEHWFFPWLLGVAKAAL